MKHTVKRTTAAILAALILAGTAAAAATFAAPTIAHATEPLPATSGSCGATASDNVTWRFDSISGTLTISGSGAMANYGILYSDTADTPWKNYKNDIKKIVIGERITSIGTYNFALLPNLENITFEGNSELQTIGGFAFYNSGWK